MKSKVIAGIITVVVIGTVALSRNTDAIFVTGSIVFFAIAVAYAEWCEKL